jgi:hypothetical protein
MLLTVPALLVGHQYLALQAAPATLLTALLRGFTGSGRVALGLVPLLLGFAATTDIAPELAVAALLGVSLHALLLTMGRLERLEAAAHPSDWSARGRMGLLVLGWGALYGLIGLRLAWNVATFAAGTF